MRRPSYTALVVLTLAVGIGACSAVFTVVHSVLLRPLPFRSPERLALIPSLNQDATGKVDQYGVSLRDLLEWRQRSRMFSDMAAMQPSEFAVTGLGDPEQVDGGFATSNLFDTLGARPHAGRYFSKPEEVADANVAVISYGYWKRRFGGTNDVLSQNILVDGISRQVIGIAPESFFFAAGADVWLPMNTNIPYNALPPGRNMAIAGRLVEGATMEQAALEMKSIAGQLAREIPADAGWGATALPLRETYVRDVRGILYFLFGAVSFFLLMVCINTANLTLVRNVERRPEFMVRAALGASRSRLVKETLIENLFLSVAGGLLGVALSRIALKPIIALSPLMGTSPAGDRILNSVTFDYRVLLFALGLSVAIGIAISIIPALQVTRDNLADALKSGERRTAGSRRQRGLQNALVAAQIATSFLLLIGALLMAQNFLRLTRIDPGFNTKSLLTARISLPRNRYETHEQRAQFQQQVLEKVRAMPGVVSASLTTRLPLNEFAMTTFFEVDGMDNPKGGFVANFRRIGPSYFQTLQTGITEGREFTSADDAASMPVVIVSRAMAKRFWPGQSAIGKRIRRTSATDTKWRTVVGVAEDLNDASLTAPPGLTFYIPYQEASFPAFHLVLRTAADPEQALASLRKTVQEIDKDLPLYQQKTAEQIFLDSLSRPRFSACLLGVFAILGLFVALVGVYGVVSYSTAQRTNEIGIRMAVGAKRISILGLILGQSAQTSVWGILIGIIASVIVERSIPPMWQASGRLQVYLLSAAVLALITAVASWIPAARATRLDPIVALRYE